MIYGYRRRPERSRGDMASFWDATEDPEAMLLSDAEFVPAEDAETARAILEKRYPCPEGLDAKRVEAVYSSGATGATYQVWDWPVMDQHENLPSVERLVGICLQFGGFLVSNRRRYGPSLVEQIRQLTGYRESDLVFTSPERDIEGRKLLVLDPQKALRRQKADTTIARGDKRVLKRQALREAAAKRDADETRLGEAYETVLTACQELIEGAAWAEHLLEHAHDRLNRFHMPTRAYTYARRSRSRVVEKGAWFIPAGPLPRGEPLYDFLEVIRLLAIFDAGLGRRPINYFRRKETRGAFRAMLAVEALVDSDLDLWAPARRGVESGVMPRVSRILRRARKRFFEEARKQLPGLAKRLARSSRS